MYDVIVAGAGPSGSYCSYLLARAGLNVLLVEKEKLPRYKCCAGGVTKKAENLLDFSIEEVVEDRCYVGECTLDFIRSQRFEFDSPLIALVMRDRFDYLLTCKAREAGAIVSDGEKILAVTEELSKVKVKTSGGIHESRFVVGADGVHSIVAKELGLHKKQKMGPAIEGEIFFDDQAFKKTQEGLISYDYGWVPRGYAWIFPKAKHLSIGVFSTKPKVKGFKDSLRQYVEKKEVFKNHSKLDMFGAMIPLGGKKDVFHSGRCLLVGDAASAVDPFTGEGIYYGMYSAALAVPVLQKAVKNNEGAGLSPYSDALNRDIHADLKYARLFATGFYNFPRALLGFVIKRQKVMREYYRVISGETSYRDFIFFALKNILSEGRLGMTK